MYDIRFCAPAALGHTLLCVWQRWRSTGMLACVSLFLCGCVSNGDDPLRLAPAPPSADMDAVRYDARLALSPEQIDRIEQRYADDQAHADRAKPQCSLSARFDRDQELAYQWGKYRRSRLSLDVSGIELSPFGSSFDIERIEMRYAFRLQDFQTPKQRCRSEHNWQGLIGSGYHEVLNGDRAEIQKALHELRDKVF